MDMAASPLELLRWSEALAGVARTGLGFTQSLYERERFEEVLKIAADMRVDRLLGVCDPWRRRMMGVPLYLIAFACHAVGGELKGHPLETADVGFFARDALPQPLAMRPDWIELAFRAIDGEAFEPFFDDP